MFSKIYNNLQLKIFGIIYPAINSFKISDPEFVNLHNEFYHTRNGVCKTNQKYQFNGYTIDAAYFSNELIPHPKQRLHIILLGGNSTCYEKFEDTMCELARKNYNVIAFNPMGVGFSTGNTTCPDDYSLALETVINNLLSDGVLEKNIVLYGHSFGAAIATIVAAKFHANDKPIKLINDRSFAELAPLGARLFFDAINNTIIRFTIGFLAYCLVYFLIKLLRLNINPAQSFYLINQKNPGDAICIIVENDEIIPYTYSIEKHITSEHASLYCNVFGTSYKNPHNLDLSLLVPKSLKLRNFTNAEDFFNQCLFNFEPETEISSAPSNLSIPTAQPNITVLSYFKTLFNRFSFWETGINVEPNNRSHAENPEIRIEPDNPLLPNATDLNNRLLF